MKKSLFFVLGTLFLSSMFFASCKGEDNEDENPVADNQEKKEDDSHSLDPGKLDPAVEAKLATKTYTYEGVSFKMIYVQGGTFKMGAQPSDNTKDGYDSHASWSESPVHDVTLTSYAIGETEVTQELWNTLSVKPNEDLELRSDLMADDKPIYFMTQKNAMDFIDLLNTRMHRAGTLDPGLQFALPTEAQWEYAARGGVNSKKYYYSGSNSLKEVAETGPDFSPVKSFMPNELGIYDMTGNASELTRDYWSEDGYITTSEIDPVNEVVDDFVTFRGGLLGSSIETNFRLTNRMKIPVNNSPYFMSFRMVLVAVK